MIWDLIKDAFSEREFVSLEEEKDFTRFFVERLFNDYNDNYMANETKYKTLINDLEITLPNGTVGKDYAASFIIPTDIATITTIERTESSKGLEISNDENGQVTISGSPENAGDIDLIIKYTFPGWIEGKPVLERKISFSINPDPRTLWQDIPTPKNIDYYQEDFDSDYVKVEAINGIPQKDIVAASVRGRSHAHKGNPRDDHFLVTYNEENGWYVMSVADGAGSAKFSRKGATIACETVVNLCSDSLKDGSLDPLIEQYHTDNTDANRKLIGDKIYGILGTAAYKAAAAIKTEAALKDAEAKAKMAEMNAEAKKLNPNAQDNTAADITARDFATTLLLTISKKFEFGWFIASFWVGDGAICIYKKGTVEQPSSHKILGVPDGGEFAGQTRFITMPEIFKDAAAIYSRLRFSIEEDFTALMLMTDGVSDAKFETDANLNKIDMWDTLWKDLAGDNEDKCAVDLNDDNDESQYQLLKWLNFWSQGNHDDRTIAILY